MFHIKFKTDGSAFDKEGRPELEVSRILRLIADTVDDQYRDGTIHDINGNRIGEWKWTNR